MPTKQALEKYNIIQLAVYCGQVADNSATDEKTAEEAWRLKREWVSLVAREPAPNYKEHSEIEDTLAKLKTRMAEFLAIHL